VNAALASLDRLKGAALVPIYTEVAQSSLLAPVEAAKKESASNTAPVTGAPASPQSNGAATATNTSTGSAPLAVEAVTSGYTQVLLDTSVARAQLDAARSALDGGDLKTADNSLKLLEQSIVLESSAARLPLVRARENLWLASVAARRGDRSEAKTQLQAAARALGYYRQAAPPADVADVEVLQREIAGYASSPDSQRADAAARIDKWWDRVADLTDRKG
jgi:hypothetical protein